MAVRYTDEMLKSALAKARDLRLEAIEQVEVEHELSAGFKKKMDRLIKAERKPYYSLVNTQWKRIAAIIIAVLIIGITTIVSVPALRTGLYEMIEDIYEKYSRISFRKVSEAPIELGPFIEYGLSYVPEGFTFIEGYVDVENHRKTHIYSDGKNQINFRQSLLHGSRFMLNTEDAEFLTEYINGAEMYYLKQEDFELIFWHDGTYLLIVSVFEDREILMDVVLGVEKK